MQDYDVLVLNDYQLQSGETLPAVQVAYKTYGTLDGNRRSVIIFPTHYSGRHSDNAWLIGPGKALDPERYFIVVPNMLGNGISTSPSNTPAPHGRGAFPHVTIYDNVALQYRLVTEVFGVERLALVVGFSMGAQQAYQWAVSYPDLVERIAPICGSARTSPHNVVFIEGVTAALKADATWHEGWYDEPPLRGLRALGRVWAGWGVSQAFYRQEVYLEQGYVSLEDYIVRAWESPYLSWDANDLLAMAWTWQHADIGAVQDFDGDIDRALRSIRAHSLVMPCATDLYFPPEDSVYEVEHIPGAELRPIPSVWGHIAGGGSNTADAMFIDGNLKEWLAW